MGTYRGLNLSGGLRANFRKIKVKKTVDEMEISDRGAITGTPSDLTTKGAGHRRGRNNNQRRGARGATRESVDYGFITGADSNIVTEHDYGTVIENTTTTASAVFETRRSLGFAASIAEEETAVATQITYPETVSLYNSTGIIPAGTPLILNEDGTVSAVEGSSGGSGPYTYTTDTNPQEWEVDADYQNQSYPDRWGETWKNIATNGTYTVIGDALYEELDNGNKTYSGGHAWIIRNSDGAVMKSWNSVVDGDSPNDATLVSFGGTTTGGVTYANSKYNQAAFGNAVAINNNYAFVSAGYIGTNQFGTDPNFGRGELYVFSLEDFSLVTVIDKPAAYPDSGSWSAAGSTGWAQQTIILDDNTMVISAPSEDSPSGTTNTSDQEGSIYVYDISGDPANWPAPTKLTNPIPDNSTDRPTNLIWWNFGNAIAVDFTAQKMVVEWGQINNGHHSAVYDFSSGWSNTPINRRTVAFQAYPGGSFNSLQGDTYYYWTTDNLTLHAVDISQAASGIYTPLWSKQFFGGSYSGGDYVNAVMYDESYAYISNVSYDDPTYSDQGQILVADLSNSGNVIDTIGARQSMTSEVFGRAIILGTGGTLIVGGKKSASVGPNNDNLSRLYLYQVGPGAGSTNLTADNYIGFAGSDFSYSGSLGQVITAPGIVTGLSGLLTGETYYLQNDGSISITQSDITLGTATSESVLQLASPTSWAGALGQVAGGWDSAARSTVDSINISTDISTTSHANLTSQAAFGDHAVSTGSYAVMPAGGTSMHKWSIPTGGDSSSFGDSLTSNNAQRGSAAGNGVRGVWRGNNDTRYNKFEWMALDTGGACQHFADLPTQFGTDDAMAGNDTKGLSGMGSHTSDYGGTQRCYYVIYDTTGTATNFGNLGRDATRPCAAGDDTHGLWAGGGHANYSTVYSGITAVTYDTGGTAISGGSISRARSGGCAMSDKTYVIFMGGYANGNVSTGARNDIDKRVIATGGNATLIGNLSTKRVFSSGTSGNAS